MLLSSLISGAIEFRHLDDAGRFMFRIYMDFTVLNIWAMLSSAVQ